LSVALVAFLWAWGYPPGGAQESAPTPAAAGVSILPVRDRAFVHISIDAQGIPSNGLIAVTDRGLLLIDTAWTEPQTEMILRYGDTVIHKPWIGAVITHDHGDRAGGVGALLRRGIPVAALDLTVAKMEKRGVHGGKTLFAAAAGTFKDERGFEAFYPGPGHAPDNIVLKLDSLVFGGCLIKSTAAQDLGYTGDADLAAWPGAVRRVAARYPKADIIVPGHGPLDNTGTAYAHTLDLLGKPQPKR
jgi:metallo-beta-lactamase class B